MKSAHTQRGMSFISWLVVLGFLAFMASAVFKVLPHYFDYMSMEKIITAPETDKALEIRTVGEFYAHITKGMQVNNIRDLNAQDVVKIKIENNQFLVNLKYEKRESLIENISLVVSFDKEFRVGMP
jgi:hypothetical protein